VRFGKSFHLYLQATYDKLKSEVPKYKMITTSILSDRLKVRVYTLRLPLHSCVTVISLLPICALVAHEWGQLSDESCDV
jgi:hypothetical protein